MRLLFTRAPGQISKLIRRITWHHTSHTAITDGITVWECRHDTGCHKMPYDEWCELFAENGYEEIPIDIDDATVIRRLESRKGNRYDFFALIGYLFHSNSGDKSKLFCSEYIAWAINYDHRFFHHEKYFRIAPRHLYIAAYAHNRARYHG